MNEIDDLWEQLYRAAIADIVRLNALIVAQVPGTQAGDFQKPHWGTDKPADAPKSPERVKADKAVGQAVRNMTGGWKPNINGG